MMDLSLSDVLSMAISRSVCVVAHGIISTHTVRLGHSEDLILNLLPFLNSNTLTTRLSALSAQNSPPFSFFGPMVKLSMQ